MIHFLLILSYYKANISNYKSYYTKLSYLEYGFKENAKFSMNFSSVNVEMIFGLATREEIKRIEKLDNKKLYCKGIYTLSDIQFYIKSDQKVQGEILSKNILTPYCLACNSSYSFTVQFNYQNGRNHLDYRCQILLLFTLIFLCIMYLYLIFYIIYSYFCIKKRNRTPFNTLIIYVFVTFLVQDSITFFYFQLQNTKEYFLGNTDTINNDIQNTHFILRMISHCGIFLSFVLIFCFSFIKYLKDNKKRTSCCLFNLLIFPIICLSGIAPTMFHIDVFGSAVAATILILIFIFYVLLLPPICTLAKSALAFYLFGVFLSCPVISVIINYFSGEISVHYVIFIGIIIFCVFQMFSVILFTINLCVFDSRSHNTPILQNQSSYTSPANDNSQSVCSNVITDQELDITSQDSPYIQDNNRYSSIY